MELSQMVAAQVEYRCVLVLPDSLDVFSCTEGGHHRLPRVHVAPKSRPVQEIQRAVKAEWGLDVFVLEYWKPEDGDAACVFAEVQIPKGTSPLKEVSTPLLMHGELSEDEYLHIRMLIDGRTSNPVSHVGWIDEAIAWIESATGRTFCSKNIEQWNAGGGFALFRIRSDDGRHYWLKATGTPNTHEFGVMRLLWALYPDFLPKLVAIRKEWNAWLTEDGGNPLPIPPSQSELVRVARQMARFQFLTIGRTDKMLAVGAVDQRIPALRNHIDAIIAYLIGAMARQTSTKAAPLSPDRLLELGEILRSVCVRLEELDVPDTLLHNDLNAGNILCTQGRCVFTDWSEAAIGNPLLACERLCQLNANNGRDVRAVYRTSWAGRVAMESIDQAILLAQPLAIYAYLYGRGDWLELSRTRLEFDSYARSLARHMDRASQSQQLRRLLCQ